MLIEDLIPYIDANFRTLADQPHRAMAGLSMGGMQTRSIAPAHLDKFSHIGVFSGGSIAVTNITDMAAFKEKVKLCSSATAVGELGTNRAAAAASAAPRAEGGRRQRRVLRIAEHRARVAVLAAQPARVRAVAIFQSMKSFSNNLWRRVIWPFLAVAAGGHLGAQTLTSIGSAAPSPGVNEISQLATSNTTWPDGINYFTDNNPIAGQTFTTGSNPMNFISLSVKTAGLNSGGGYGTPAITPTYFLRIYSISGNTATHLITFSSPNPGFTDGDWMKWSGMKVPLEANKTYGFSFGTKPGNGGWAALAVAANAYAGGEIAMIPVNGGAITTGASHSFDAAFALDLEEFPPDIPGHAVAAPTYGFNLGNTFEATWGYPSPTQAVLISAANAGFNAVRIPCAWNFNADPNTYQINPAYMAEVKRPWTGPSPRDCM